jgi:transposase, IS5 family
VDLFALVLEWRLQFEPELPGPDRLLTDDVLFQQLKAGVAQRYPRSIRIGRPLSRVEVVLRLLVVKHLCGWSYEQTEQFVNDSVALRQF